MSSAFAAAVRAAPEPLPADDRVMQAMRRAYHFIDISQVDRDVENADYYYRHRSKGAWPFSTNAHGWPISDWFEIVSIGFNHSCVSLTVHLKA